MVSATEWDHAFHQLKFVFGEYCFHTARFEAVELTTHVSRLDASLEETTASAVPLLERYGVVVIPAHPICADPKSLTITRDYLRYVATPTVHYFINSVTQFDEYLSRMPRKSRHEIRRKLRRFVEHSGGESICGRTAPCRKPKASILWPVPFPARPTSTGSLVSAFRTEPRSRPNCSKRQGGMRCGVTFFSIEAQLSLMPMRHEREIVSSSDPLAMIRDYASCRPVSSYFTRLCARRLGSFASPLSISVSAKRGTKGSSPRARFVARPYTCSARRRSICSPF